VYRWIEHTGELELEIEASNESSVFEDAAAALRELMNGEKAGAKEAREIEVVAADRPTLLAEWLSELLFFAETEDFVPLRLAHIDLRSNKLRARVDGYLGRPSHLVKAVTYHRLEFEPANGGWRARVVLDV
jgi:SHS2 domain-containing protein